MNSIEEEQNKANNNLIKRYVSILVRYIKTCEPEMVNFIFYNIEKSSPLIFQFNNFTEIVLKLSIKLWSTTPDEELRKILLGFIKSLITKKPKFFEYSIKIFYINYLNIAKEMNLNTFNHIKFLQDDIINILNYDLQKAYTTIFTFIRKLCIQLRATIVDKTSGTIKSIYNWQFVNSLILWGRVIMKYISDSNIYLLIYPLIQTIIGVIRLNSSEQFYLLRIRLVILLNGISRVSGIFIPTPMYILPILSSNYFIEKCKPIQVSTKKKKEGNEDDIKHKPKINTRIVINVSLKIKKEELKIKQIRKDLLEECCDCLLEYLSINSNKICFTELADNILKEMRSALKNIYDKEYREIINLRMEKIENNIKVLHDNLSNNYNKSIILIKPNTIDDFEKQNINDFNKEWQNIRRRRQATFEAIKSQKQNKFIEV
jgi:nucleolar complex protein 2